MKNITLFFLSLFLGVILVLLIGIPQMSEDYRYSGNFPAVTNSYINPTTEVQKNSTREILPITVLDKKHSPIAFISSALSLSSGSAKIHLEAGSLSEPKDISIEGLEAENTPPLDQGMVNVTGEHTGFRMLPHGEFEKDITVILPYDTTLIPVGYSEQEIHTYYYNERLKTWQVLKRDSIDTENKLVVSKVNHFTDFVNAIIKTPDMPETQAYTPTSIKDLKAANPLEGLPLFQPPTANNNGTANMHYPILIPAGRGGMQPNLALTYNSGGGNGWLGVGWDISIPAITVDTRWGVPRYNPEKESEVYLYQGEQLVTKNAGGKHNPMPHRTNIWQNRNGSGLKQFYPRVEEAFDSIVRHGTTPANYWWSITDRNGVTHYYGKKKGTDILDPQAVLRDAAGNIAHWALTESVDPYGNSIRYYYNVVSGYNTANEQGNAGTGIYISYINYTGSPTENGRYNILFNRLPSLRKDVQVNGRYGFKEVNGQLLCNLQVQYEKEIITTYYFFTENNRASAWKTRLTDLVKIDNTDNMYNFPCGLKIEELPWGKIDAVRYNFAYYDYPAADKLFISKPELTLPNDNVQSTFKTSQFNSENGRASALGASKGKSWNVGGTLGIGIGVNVCMSTVSLGGNYTYNNSASEGLLTLIDLDGDGLADKVFKQNGKLYYRKQIPVADGQFILGEKVLLEGVEDFMKESSSSSDWGFQASAGLTLSATWPTTTSTTTNYFADVNADGLVDLITDKGVYFNSLVNGKPTFNLFQVLATTPPDNAAAAATPTYVVTSATAPCGGIIFDGEVSDSIMCQTDTLYEGVCKPAEVSYYENLGYIVEIDASGQYYHMYKITTRCEYPLRDPDVDAVKVWVAPMNGTITLHSTIQLLEDTSEARRQSRMANGVRYAVQHNINTGFLGVTPAHANHNFNYHGGTLVGTSQELFNGTLLKDDYIPVTQTRTLNVKQNDILFFRLQSRDSRVFDNVKWTQEIVYDHVTGTDQFGKEKGRYHSAEDFVLNGKAYFQAPENGTVTVTGEIRCGNLNRPAIAKITRNGVVEKTDTLYSNTVKQITKTFAVNQFNNIKVEIYGDDDLNTTWGNIRSKFRLRFQGNFAATENVTVYDSLIYYPVPMLHMNTGFTGTLENRLKKLFGDLYRGWGQFGYNNNYPNASVTHPIDITQLKLPGFLAIESASAEDTSAIYLDESIGEDMSRDNLTATFSEIYTPLSTNTRWIEMMADGETQSWMSYGNIAYIKDEEMSNARPKRTLPADPVTGEPEQEIPIYDSPVPVSMDGFPVMSIRKQNMSDLSNTAFGVDAVFVSSGESESFGSNRLLTDYMDLNGDRYPDIVTEYNVQYSNPWGGIGGKQPLTKPGICESQTTSDGTTFGASYLNPKRGSGGDQKKGKISFDGNGQLGASHGRGSDHAVFTFQDINGDGLPDRITGKNNVMLNIGYGFLAEEPWNQGYAREGESENTGLSVSGGISFGNFDLAQASIGGGTGMNWSKNSTKKMLMDINGDGLPDQVSITNSRITVSYNMGNGTWSSSDNIGLANVGYGDSYSESLNTSVTGGFTFFGILKLTIGIQSSPFNRTYSKEIGQLMDIDNDGYPDYVTSNYETGMTVKYNQAGKTNLLKEVTNFTCSRIELDYDMPASTYEQPQRSWNLAKVSTDDPYTPAGGAKTLVTIQYEKPHYDRYERINYGYAKVTVQERDTEEENQVYRYTEQDYQNRNFIKRGKLTREALYNRDERLYIEKLYEAQLVDMTNGQTVGDEECPSEVFPMYEADIVNYYEGTGEIQISTGVSRTYDMKRNIVEYIQRGDMALAEDNFKAEITYKTGMPHNLISLPTEIRISDAHGNLLRRRIAKYNNKGKVSLISQYNGSQQARTDFSYDSYGNIAVITFPPNGQGQRNYYEYTYDSQVHSYPVSIRNALGYESFTKYDFRWGKPIQTVDIAGNSMEYTYTTMGRLKTVTAPYEKDAGAPFTIRIDYYPTNYRMFNIFEPSYMTGGDISSHNYPDTFSFAATYHYTPDHFPHNYIATFLLCDGFGRFLQTKKEAEVEGDFKRIVSGKIQYDAFGRTVKQYHPVVESLHPDEMSLFFTPDSNGHRIFNSGFNPAFDPATGTGTKYDILGRSTVVRLPDGTETIMEYGFGNDAFGVKRFTTTTTDANHNAVTIYTDYRQLQTTLKAPLETVTKFMYNSFGELLESTDPDGHNTKYEYNLFGQCIARIHPDAGTTAWKYDLAGNVISIATANLEGVGAIENKYHYNQLTEVNYPQHPENNVKYTYGEPGALNNTTGRIVVIEDVSGYQNFFYGKLGETTRAIRTLVLPLDETSYTFTMKWEYDSWNRVKNITYPDGEKVFYAYNRGGTLDRVWGEKLEIVYPYINGIKYNRFESKSNIEYGNGTSAHYQYDILQRLSQLDSYTPEGEAMQQIAYTYDSVSNIKAIENHAGAVNGLGGQYEYHYLYDELYRLKTSNGLWGNGYFYGLKMDYEPDAKIARKSITASGNLGNVYSDNFYTYNESQPHTVKNILEKQFFEWDKNGNMTAHHKGNGFDHRYLCWDEENRLRGVADDHYASFYFYDASGERAIKLTGTNSWIDINGIPQGFSYLNNLTLYTSPYLVASQKGYTKHYYIENQRIASKLGNGGLQDLNNANGAMTVDEKEKRDAKVKAFARGMLSTSQCLNLKQYSFEFKMDCPSGDSNKGYEPCLFQYTGILGGEKEPDKYFYHPDHLGSSSWITDAGGKPIQHLVYLPFGEEFVDQRTSNWSAMYKFTGKEKDEETGYNYFGARYYISDLSIWASIDPLSDKYPSLSAYNYCANNPVKLIDPNGREIVPLGKSANTLFMRYLSGFKGIDYNDVRKAFSLTEAFYKNVYSTSVSYRDFKRNYKEVTGQKLDKKEGAILYKALTSEKYYEIAAPVVEENKIPFSPPASGGDRSLSNGRDFETTFNDCSAWKNFQDHLKTMETYEQFSKIFESESGVKDFILFDGSPDKRNNNKIEVRTSVVNGNILSKDENKARKVITNILDQEF